MVLVDSIFVVFLLLAFLFLARLMAFSSGCFRSGNDDEIISGFMRSIDFFWAERCQIKTEGCRFWSGFGFIDLFTIYFVRTGGFFPIHRILSFLVDNQLHRHNPLKKLVS